ncbi:hypothetical protein [Parerythrobacter jejuensis]|uniref:Porin n=1 Tax=Parerythrobacter jejuensis TaxID=795812 RepID=A0A845AU42_9SPHN|nr:hypothetical protein [Parerythrobacter jejuensis]MXP31090.1 hypothetical protein [Parerythrobacter jejuensis]MXP33850.1 hypothetical protein [Parerythrobacter jejuensis]
MSRNFASTIKQGLVPTLVAAGALLAIPTASLAVSDAVFAPLDQNAPRFTPGSVDPVLAERVNNRYAASRKALRFTPAGGKAPGSRTVTVAVRVDDETARAISVRSAIDMAENTPGNRKVTIAPTRFDLGVARGYQSFAKPAARLPAGVSKIEMPDLAQFRPSDATAEDKPSRFQPRIALETERNPGRAPRTLEGLGEQSVDLGGSYRVSRNIDVTAGVRLSQERDRLAPLTDGVEDSQAVYVGTQLRF